MQVVLAVTGTVTTKRVVRIPVIRRWRLVWEDRNLGTKVDKIDWSKMILTANKPAGGFNLTEFVQILWSFNAATATVSIKAFGTDVIHPRVFTLAKGNHNWEVKEYFSARGVTVDLIASLTLVD